MILFVLFILLIVGVIVWVTWKLTDIAANRPSKAVKPTQEPQAKPKRKSYRTVMIYPDDQERAEDFMRYYKPNKTDWYSLSKKELIEDHNGERVYKYYPENIPHKFEGTEVLSEMKGEWYRIGTITEDEKEEIIKYNGTLVLFGGTYKEVYDDVEIIEDDPFFGFKVRKLE